MKTLKVSLLALVAVATQASAASITMSGNYVLTAVNSYGTLGSIGSAYPGLRHDPSGAGAWGSVVDDYLTPGTPWEGFSVKSQYGLQHNNNNFSSPITQVGSLVDLSGGAYDHRVVWNGNYGPYYSISQDTFFNNGDERINIRTTITALTDLTGLQYLRAIDPDQDVYSHGSYYTVNGRGHGVLAPTDWVHSEGVGSGLTLGLYSTSLISHNTGVSSPLSTNPSDYLAGVNDGNGDFAIGVAFNIGNLNQGQSVTLDYAYVMGGSIDTVDIPSTPETGSTAVLAAMSLFGLVFISSRMKK